ncbi:MAG: glycosyltransferase [Clostridia bacterium]|nr:glycosyltransferase [Clostridia bacterium]
MEIIKSINYLIAVIFCICYSYQIIYILIPFILKPKKHKSIKKNKYAVLISARNEEKVIANLIETIKKQDYPQKLIKIFVVADNCTDNTAQIAKDAGAIVFERFNKNQVGKGYALDFLLQKIQKEYSKEKFDGYFVFDADNLLRPNYITEMNKTFSDGYEVITSYRNSKNYGDNWISAGYALWFLRESKFLNESRMLLGTSCAVSGTGFLFSNKVIQRYGGWKFFLLTEDIEFSVNNIINDVKIGYCGTAILYDEQPIKFSQSWNQRMRWAKGYLQVIKKYGLKLAKKSIFDLSFSAFDMTMVMMPAVILTVVGIVCNISISTLSLIAGKGLWVSLESILEFTKNSYLMMYVIGLLTTITEWKQIHTTTLKKILYTFTFPLFMATYIPISFVAFFKKVEWKPIEHTKVKTLDEVVTKKKIAIKQ